MSVNTVLVVDDFQAVRTAVVSALQQTPNLQVISEASDGLEAIKRAREWQPSLILLDVGLPGQNGLSAAREIRKHCPNSKILFLSVERSVDIAQEALSIGAHGYLLKSELDRDLLVAVYHVLQDKPFVSPALNEK